ncbi:MAG: DUF481 domain-containing protein [Terracidiphilus sp.]
MNIRALTISSALPFLFALPLFARNKTDVLIMKNGDRMTCEVKGLSGGVLYVSFDYIDGTASVDWSKVGRLESTQLFVVKTESGIVYTGTLKTPERPEDQPVKIEVVENAENRPEVIERSQIVDMVATSDRFWERFSGDITFGTIYSKGNSSTQFNLSSNEEYVRERWNASAGFSSSLSSSAGASASARNSLTLVGQHLLPPKNWFYEGVGSALQSSEQQIRNQITLGGGVGRYLKNTNNASIAVLGGLGWQGTNYENSEPQVSKQNLATALIFANARFFRFSKTSLNIDGALLPAVSQPGRLKFQINASYYVKIIGDLKFNVSFYGNWDNEPPPNLPGSDYGTSSGLTWTWGLK